VLLLLAMAITGLKMRVRSVSAERSSAMAQSLAITAGGTNIPNAAYIRALHRDQP
jgi:hypothetical protein